MVHVPLEAFKQAGLELQAPFLLLKSRGWLLGSDKSSSKLVMYVSQCFPLWQC